jgi:hypothetical protein
VKINLFWFRVTLNRSKGKLRLLIEWYEPVPWKVSELAPLKKQIPSTGLIILDAQLPRKPFVLDSRLRVKGL